MINGERSCASLFLFFFRSCASACSASVPDFGASLRSLRLLVRAPVCRDEHQKEAQAKEKVGQSCKRAHRSVRVLKSRQRGETSQGERYGGKKRVRLKHCCLAELQRARVHKRMRTPKERQRHDGETQCGGRGMEVEEQ